MANVKIHGMRPQRPSPKMVKPPKMRLKDLLKATNKQRRDASATVAIRSLRKIASPKGLDTWTTMYAQTYSKDTKKNYAVHVFSPQESIVDDSLVVVNCSCEDYTFTYEVANSKRGAAFVYRSNGDDPGVRNPTMTPGLCKHAYLVCREIDRLDGAQP